MTQTIDQARLKAAAERLEWVLRQYPDEPVVQGLLESLLPLIEDAKAGQVRKPVASMQDIPGAYNFGNGVYVPYKGPSVGGAYADFVTEMEGGLTEQDKERYARIDRIRKAVKAGAKP